MNIAKKAQQGFTLIELMIVVAIIGILASIAIPQYEAFIQRSEFKVMETGVASYKLGVEMCAQERSSDPTPLSVCQNGAGGIARPGRLGDIPAATVTGSRADAVDTIAVAANGVITATSYAGAFGQTAATTYILTPAITSGNVIWTMSGTCVAARLCR